MSDASDFSAATGASTVELPVSRATDRLVIRHHPRFTTIGPGDGGISIHVCPGEQATGDEVE